MNLVKRKTDRWFPSMFEDFFNDIRQPADNITRFENTLPAVNIKEGRDAYTIEMAAPGKQKYDFDIALEDDVLTISSERKFENEEKNGKYTRKEYNYSSFSRSFSLPESAAQDKIKAGYKNGVLRIDIPKLEERRQVPKRSIEIS